MFIYHFEHNFKKSYKNCVIYNIFIISLYFKIKNYIDHPVYIINDLVSSALCNVKYPLYILSFKFRYLEILSD